MPGVAIKALMSSLPKARNERHMRPIKIVIEKLPMDMWRTLWASRAQALARVKHTKRHLPM